MIPFTTTDTARKMLLSLVGRLIIGLLMYKAFSATRAEAAPTDTAIGKTKNCTAERIESFLAQPTRGPNDTLEAGRLYDECNREFLANNHVSASVKETVDNWFGIDIGEASASDLLLAYQLAISSEKPSEVSEQFVEGCERMFQRYDSYRTTVEPLNDYLNVNTDLLLVEGDNDDGGANQLNPEGRKLLNFMQYTQFCKLILLDQAE